jgi:hypothetical protein
MESRTRYSLRPARVALVLSVIMLALICLHVFWMQAYFNDDLGLRERFGFHYWQIAFFDLDEEESFGTWFSSGMLFSAALLLLHQARIVRAEAAGWQRSWLVLGIGFCFLSIDEVVGMHEFMNTMMGSTPWTVVGFPILFVVGSSYVPFLWHHRERTGRLFLLAGAIYGGGAVFVEHFTDSQVNSLHYNMWSALEEGMEQFGVIVFIYALLDHMRRSANPQVQFEVELAGSGAGS